MRSAAEYAAERLTAVADAEDDRLRLDIVDWAHENFWIRNPRRLIPLMPHQCGLLRLGFTRRPGGQLTPLSGPQTPVGTDVSLRYPFSLFIYSTIKKSGKSSIGGIALRYIAETQTDHGECYCIGNDLKQARERSFKFARTSIVLTPGYQPKLSRGAEGILPGRWHVQKGQMTCLTSGTVVEALPIDATGEAGGEPDFSVWTEAWGMDAESDKLMWEEMVNPPTKPDSMRMVETYAGFTGQSLLLEDLYERGMMGRQLTNGEFARLTHREQPGATYDEMLLAFEECEGQPDDPLPIWVDETARILTYWDEDVQARRLPWQVGDVGRDYYAAQEAQISEPQMRRQNGNFWVGAEGEFVEIALYDSLLEELPTFDPHVMGRGADSSAWERVVLAADAAVVGDCFGVLAVTRHPEPEKRDTHVALRAAKLWRPPGNGRHINFALPEAFIRTLAQGGCAVGHPQQEGWPCVGEEGRAKYGVTQDCWACVEGQMIPGYYVVELAFDEYQLEDMTQRLRREQVVNCRAFKQGQDRLIADSKLKQVISKGLLAHPGRRDGDGALVDEFPMVREHLANAMMKTQVGEDSKLRMIKRNERAKIDLGVCLSMAVYRALKLSL